MKTAFVVIWFGKWPIYLNLFLNSCRSQKDIDFIFLSDHPLPSSEISDDDGMDGTNIFRHPFTVDDFYELASEKMGFDVCLKSAYKLCDFKPAWTHIAEDYLRNYRYVGYCDIDLVLGDVKKFIQPLIRGGYNFLTATSGYCSGAFTLYVNEPRYRCLYQKANGYKEIMTNDRHFAFDEYLNTDEFEGYESFSDVVKREILNGNIKAYHGHDEMALEVRPNTPVEWRRKSVRYQGREWMFFHYVVAKQSMFFTMPDWQVIPDTFFVNKYGFYKKGQSPIRFRDLFTNTFLFGQVRAAFRKKAKTIKRLIRNMQVKVFINAIRKQF